MSTLTTHIILSCAALNTGSIPQQNKNNIIWAWYGMVHANLGYRVRRGKFTRNRMYLGQGLGVPKVAKRLQTYRSKSFTGRDNGDICGLPTPDS